MQQAAARPSKEDIAEILRERIVSGALPMGASLSDKDLASELQVSRTPVREALLALACDDLVRIRPRSGTFVFSLRDEELRDICELRGIYESGALRIAAKRDAEGLVARLTRIVARANFAFEAGDLDACESLDAGFHETLVALCGNDALRDAYRRIAGKVSALRAVLPKTPERMRKALTQHRRIIDLAAAGRIEDAALEIEDHVSNVNRVLDRVRTANKEAGADKG